MRFHNKKIHFYYFLINKLFFSMHEKSFQTLHAIKVAVRYHYESMVCVILSLFILNYLIKLIVKRQKLWFQYMGACQLRYNYNVANSFFNCV